MKLREYVGHEIQFVYPAHLKVRTTSSEWGGIAKNSAACIELNLPPYALEAVHRIIHAELLPQEPLVNTVIRGGDFSTVNGITAFERLIKTETPIGQVIWNWELLGSFLQRCSLHVKIFAVEAVWEDGKPWEEFLQSIRPVGAAEAGSDFKNPWPVTPPTPKKIKRRSKPSGVLLKLPAKLKYLLDPALMANAIGGENLEDHEELLEAVEQVIKNEARGKAKSVILARLRQDRDQLGEWLHEYPAECHPEVVGMAFIYGVMQQAESIVNADP